VWAAGGGDPTSPAERVDHVTLSAHSISGEQLFQGRVDRDAQSAGSTGQATFAAPAGSIRLHVEAETASGRRIEARDTTVEVPDFTSTTAQITMPFVYRGRTARDLQQVRTATTPPLPTTERSFSRTERLLLRFDAYGPAGTTPTVTMKVLNQQGGTMAAMPPPTSTGDHKFESEFSLSAFPPGDYLIEIAGTSNGETIKRLFAMRVIGQ
jgi:hypothetical protein